MPRRRYLPDHDHFLTASSSSSTPSAKRYGSFKPSSGLTRLSLAGAAPSLFFADGPTQLSADGSTAWPAAAPSLRVLDLSARADLRPSQLARIHVCAPKLAALRIDCVLSSAHIAAFCLGFVDELSDENQTPPHAEEPEALDALIAKETLTSMRKRLDKSRCGVVLVQLSHPF